MEDATPKPQRSLPIRDSRSRSPRSRTPPSDDEDMNARTPVARNGRRANDEKDASERERELAEQLRQ